jgi:hypothetical protein
MTRTSVAAVFCAAISLIPFTGSAQVPEVPQWVYEQLSDPSVPIVNMPTGTYKLMGASVVNQATPLGIYRSNVTVNAKDFIL